MTTPQTDNPLSTRVWRNTRLATLVRSSSGLGVVDQGAVVANGERIAYAGPFREGIAFSPDQVARVFAAATALRLPVKLHADQLSNLHGAALAATHNALSADHLEHSDEHSVSAMAAAGTVAVLLPGAFYFLRERTLPPIELLRRHCVAIALATDSNPGTSPLTSRCSQ